MDSINSFVKNNLIKMLDPKKEYIVYGMFWSEYEHFSSTCLP